MSKMMGRPRKDGKPNTRKKVEGLPTDTRFARTPIAKGNVKGKGPTVTIQKAPGSDVQPNTTPSVKEETPITLSVVRTDSAPQYVNIFQSATGQPTEDTTSISEPLVDSDDEKTEEQICQEAEQDMLHSQLPGNSLNTKLNTMIRKQVVKEEKVSKKEEKITKKKTARQTEIDRINQIIDYHNSEVLEKTEDKRWMEKNKGLDWGLKMRDLLPACQIEPEYEERFMEEHKCEIIIFEAYLRDPKGFVNSDYVKGKSPEEVQRIIQDSIQYQHIK